MAITWSTFRSGGGNRYRMGVDLSYSPTTITPSTSSVTVTAKLYMQSEYASWGGSDSWWMTTVLGGGIDASNVGGWNWTTTAMQELLVATRTESVSLSYASTQPYKLTGRGKDLGSSSLDISISPTITIPRRPVALPASLINFTVSRASDSRQNLSWTREATTNAPYDSIEIRRADNVADYVTIASLPGTATSYSDTSTRADRHYRYAVRPVNSAGTSNFAYASIDTIPAKPGAPSAAKNSSGDIVVTRPALSGVAATWDVREADGSTLATGLSASTSSWTHSNPSTVKTWAYQVRAVSASPVLSSAWSASSNTVQLLAPPLAPSGLGPSVVDATLPLTLYWTHNSVDTTAQTAYEIQHRLVGSSTWTSLTGKVTFAYPNHTIPVGTWTNGANREWQVRTWGQHANPSPWSPTKVTNLNNRPTVGITTPTGTHNSDRLTVKWSFFDSESTVQSRWQVLLSTHDQMGDGPVVETRTGYGAANSIVLRTPLPDGSSWTVNVTAWDGSGLQSAAAYQTFTVDWAEPPTPTGVAEWHKDDGNVTVTVNTPAPGTGQTAVDHLQLWRAVGTGWVLVADNLAKGQTIADLTAPIGVAVYRVAAVSDLPSTSWSTDITVETPACWIFANYGPGFGQIIKLGSNVSVSRAASREKTLHQLAGRQYPVERAGQSRSREYVLTASLFAPHVYADGGSSWEALEELSDAPAPVLLRDPEGVRMFCSVGAVSESGHFGDTSTVTVPLTRVDWSEGEVIEGEGVL